MTADERILGVILAVAAGECSAVHVDCRCIPAIDIQIVGLVANVLAVVSGQIIVVGLGQNDDAAVGDVPAENKVAACIKTIVHQTGCRVTVCCSRLVHGLDGCRTIAGLGDQGLVIAGVSWSSRSFHLGSL